MSGSSHNVNINPNWSQTLEKDNKSDGKSPKLSDGDKLEAVNGLGFYNPRHNNKNGLNSLSNRLFVDAVNGFVGVGTPDKIGAESFRVNWYAKIDKTLGLNGAVPGSQGAINVPVNSKIIAINNVTCLWQSSTEGVTMQSLGVFKLNFDVGSGQRFMELVNIGVGTKSMNLYSRPANSGVGNSDKAIEINLHSSLYNGAEEQRKKATIIHSTQSSTGKSNLDLQIEGVTSISADDDDTAGNTRFLLYDVDSGSLKRVSVGVADSGGVGYKVLRVPN